MTKYVYGEHFTQRNHDKTVKANIYMIPQFNVQTKFYNSETGDESIATGIQVYLKNNYTNTTRRGVSDDYGQVTFYEVPAGEYTLTGVDRTKVYGDAVKRINLNKNSPTSEELMLYTPFVPEVNIRLLDSETNEPIPNLIFELVKVGGDYSNNTVSDSEGICSFRNVPTGDYSLSTRATPYYDKYESMEQINPQHYEFDCIIQSHLIKQFKVSVFNEMAQTTEERPISDANIKIHHNESGQEFTGTSDNEGYYTFTNIINGRYTVSLSHQDYRAEDRTITVHTQEEGEVEQLSMKPKYGNARIIIEDSETQEPVPEVTVKMVSADEGIPTLTLESGEDGIVNLNNIYLGKYNVLCTNKYYDDTYAIVELDHDITTTISMDNIKLDNIKFKVVNKWGNKELLDHKEVQFFKKANPTEEDQPDYTVEVEDGYTNTFIIPAGKYTVKFHDNDTMYDWVRDEYVPSFEDKFLYNVDLNKTTQEQTFEWEGNLLPELKMLALNVIGGRVKNYKFHIEGESPFTLTDILTSSDQGELSTRYSVVYGSKVRVYCYDTGTHNNDIIFDEEFIIDTWDEDYVKEIQIGARHVPQYTLKFTEYNKEGNPVPCKGGTNINVISSNAGSISGTTDRTNGLVNYNNILKEGENIQVTFNSDYYESFTEGGTSIPLTVYYDGADTPEGNRIINLTRAYFNMRMKLTKKDTSDPAWGVNVKINCLEDVYGVQDYDLRSNNDGIVNIEGICASAYNYILSRDGFKTVNGNLDLNKYYADTTLEIEMEEEIQVNIDVKDNFDIPLKSGTVTAVKGGKSYSANISDGVATLKVNSSGDYRFDIASTEKDNAGNILHYDVSIYKTIQDGQFYTTILSTLTRKSVTIIMKAKYDHGYSTDYAYGFNVALSTGQTYTATGSTCYFPVPAGKNVTITVSYFNVSAKTTVYYNAETSTQSLEVYMKRT